MLRKLNLKPKRYDVSYGIEHCHDVHMSLYIRALNFFDRYALYTILACDPDVMESNHFTFDTNATEIA